MRIKTSVIIVIVLSIVGCKTTTNRPPTPSPFALIHTIELKDATNPILLASTGAKRVREYLEIGLAHSGYVVCRDCQSDAVATVTVRKYSTRQNSKRDWVGWGNLTYLEFGETDWILSIVRNGETIFERDVSDDKAMPIDQLAGQQVQDMLERIPARKD